MASNNAYLDGQWVPSPSHVKYQDFKHWEQATRHSHEWSKNQSSEQHLRELSMGSLVSPTFTPRSGVDERSQRVQETHPDAIVFRLARNRAALEALRRTRKMRYRHNLKLLSKSFPLANEVATKEKQAREEAEKAQGLTSAERRAQKELAEKKISEMTVEELKCIKDMKAAKIKAAADKRLQDAKERAEKYEAGGKDDAKKTGKGAQESAGEEDAKKAKKSVGKGSGRSSGKRSLRRKLMPSKPVPKRVIQNPPTSQTAEKPATNQTAEKPVMNKAIKRPATSQTTEKPVANKVIKKLTTSQPVQKPATAQTMDETVTKKVIKKPFGRGILKPTTRKVGADDAAQKRVVSD